MIVATKLTNLCISDRNVVPPNVIVVIASTLNVCGPPPKSASRSWESRCGDVIVVNQGMNITNTLL